MIYINDYPNHICHIFFSLTTHYVFVNTFEFYIIGLIVQTDIIRRHLPWSENTNLSHWQSANFFCFVFTQIDKNFFIVFKQKSIMFVSFFNKHIHLALIRHTRFNCFKYKYKQKYKIKTNHFSFSYKDGFAEILQLMMIIV